MLDSYLNRIEVYYDGFRFDKASVEKLLSEYLVYKDSLSDRTRLFLGFDFHVSTNNMIMYLDCLLEPSEHIETIFNAEISDDCEEDNSDFENEWDHFDDSNWPNQILGLADTLKKRLVI